jgi:hypothetical protein
MRIKEMGGESAEVYKVCKNKQSSAAAGKKRFDMGELRAKAHRYSLRAYLKILYLPSNFKGKKWDGIFLRGLKVHPLTPIFPPFKFLKSRDFSPQLRFGPNKQVHVNSARDAYSFHPSS